MNEHEFFTLDFWTLDFFEHESHELNEYFIAHGSHGSHSKFAEGMRRSRINVKKSRQNNDC